MYRGKGEKKNSGKENGLYKNQDWGKMLGCIQRIGVIIIAGK
jgi:hypothetical protein